MYVYWAIGFYSYRLFVLVTVAYFFFVNTRKCMQACIVVLFCEVKKKYMYASVTDTDTDI